MKELRPAIVLFLAFTIVTGIIYPAIVTGASRLFFHAQAEGSILSRNGNTMGSDLIAQPFTDAKYFWPRPSAANYDATASAGSNLGPTNPALTDAIKSRVAALHAADPINSASIPIDLVTASASGLDPHLSVAAAMYQASRIATARHLALADVQHQIEANTDPATFGCLGEPRVNVLRLNLALDGK